MNMKRWEEEGWQEQDVNKLELSFLHEIFECQHGVSVNASIRFGAFMRQKMVNSDNYPLFLKILELNNHWVIDALVGEDEPTEVFKAVQPNYYILKECFNIMQKHTRGGVYPKTLLIVLGLIEQSYKNPLEGYRIYPIDQTNVNNLGKHLNEKEDQNYPLNRTILGILDKIAELVQPGRPESDENIILVSTQANNIRGKFLDMTKSLKESIPDLLLKLEDYTQLEVAPTE